MYTFDTIEFITVSVFTYHKLAIFVDFVDLHILILKDRERKNLFSIELLIIYF